jgi:hypothetical protein
MEGGRGLIERGFRQQLSFIGGRYSLPAAAIAACAVFQ